MLDPAQNDMSITRRSRTGSHGFSPPIRTTIIGGSLLLTALLSGRASAWAAEPVQTFTPLVAYDAVPSPTHVDAGNAWILFSVTHSLAPEIQKIWSARTSEASIRNYQTAVAEVLLADLKKSAVIINYRLVPAAEPLPLSADPASSLLSRHARDADLLLILQSEESRPKDFKLTMTLKLVDVATQTVLKSYAGEADLGPSFQGFNGHLYKDRLKPALQNLTGQLKSGLLADFSGKNLGEVSRRAAQLNPADLDGLLILADPSISMARNRNRALIAAAEVALPDVLRGRKTAEITDLKVRIQQLIFDLEHESAIAKDAAQNESAAGNDAEEKREWALIYKERIEILKPMLESIKAEIANRGR